MTVTHNGFISKTFCANLKDVSNLAIQNGFQLKFHAKEKTAGSFQISSKFSGWGHQAFKLWDAAMQSSPRLTKIVIIKLLRLHNQPEYQ